MEERRYIVGVIVDEKEDQAMIEQMKTDDYKMFKFPKAVQSVYTTFPFTSVFSVSIAAMRVPSRLAEFIKVYHSLPTMKFRSMSRFILDQ